MEYQFADVEPKEVLHYFEEIASIPHGSGNTKQLSDHIAAFAKEHGLNCIQDRLNDLIIFKDASEGYEGCEPVILQGHMDMVAEKNSDAAIDMAKEPIRLILDPDGDTLHADGTTLGADDGIAIAMMMAVLADDTLAHPPLECIMTVDEETGLYGAAGIDCSRIRGKKLLNLDSENEGVFTAGCAGGGQMECIFSGERKERRGTPVKIKVEGLLGGHSGDMINAGRANANQLLGRILIKLSKKAPFRIISVKGGNKDNAIPREAEAELLFPRMFCIKMWKIRSAVSKRLSGRNMPLRIRGSVSAICSKKSVRSRHSAAGLRSRSCSSSVFSRMVCRNACPRTARPRRHP